MSNVNDKHRLFCKLECRKCGKTKNINPENYRGKPWPKCHGEPMAIIEMDTVTKEGPESDVTVPEWNLRVK